MPEKSAFDLSPAHRQSPWPHWPPIAHECAQKRASCGHAPSSFQDEGYQLLGTRIICIVKLFALRSALRSPTALDARCQSDRPELVPHAGWRNRPVKKWHEARGAERGAEYQRKWLSSSITRAEKMKTRAGKPLLTDLGYFSARIAGASKITQPINAVLVETARFGDDSPTPVTQAK